MTETKKESGALADLFAGDSLFFCSVVTMWADWEKCGQGDGKYGKSMEKYG